VKPGKKLNQKRETAGEATVQGLELGAIAIAIAIVVSVPVVLDPARGYPLLKFEVLMGLCAPLLVTVLGVVVLRRGSIGVPVLVPVLAVLGASTLSALFSEDPWNTLLGDRYEGLLSLAAGVLLFYALVRCLNSPLRVRVFLAAGVAAAVLISILGISQKYGFDPIVGWGNPWYTDIGRSSSTLGHPIVLAAYLTLMIGAATALWFKAGSLLGRVPWLFALAVMGACWIYTDTRGALLGVMGALPIIFWLGQRRMGTVRPLLAPLGTLLAAMVGAVLAWAVFAKSMAGEVVATAEHGSFTLSARIPDLRILAILAAYLALVGVVLWLSSRRGKGALRFFLVVTLTIVLAITVGMGAMTLVASDDLSPSDLATNGGTLEQSSQFRVYVWRDTIPMILDSPLLGHGPDNFKEPFKPYIGHDLETAISSESGVALGVDRAHNQLLQVAATTGLLGLAAYLWVFVSYFRNAYRRGGWPLIALCGGVLAYFLQLQTGIDAIDTSVVFWAILGVSVALMRIHDREEHSSSEPNNPKPPEEDESVGASLSTQTPRGGVYELGVVVLVVGVLVAIAVPISLNQREKAAETQQEVLMLDVEKVVLAYSLASVQGEPYPEAGVYTKENPVRGPDGSRVFTPSGAVAISTATVCGGGFTVEGESNTLAGTFRYSYDSATGTYTSSSPDTSSYPDISDGLAGENMNLPRERPNGVESDASARDGLVLAFLSNQSASCTGRTSSTIEEVVFHARSGLTANVVEPATLELKIDGVSQGTLEIPGTTLSEHRFKLPEPLEPGVHTFEVAFTNDYHEGGEDRNLYVDHLTFD
jgi:type II secretory pathway pseudopilin PulG